MSRRVAAVQLACALGAGAGWVDSISAEVHRPVTEGAVSEDDRAVVALIGRSGAYCSGVLVSERVVLTAGHCVLLDPSHVFFGVSPAEDGELRAVVDDRQHPRFVPETLEHDIGLLLLDRPAPASAAPVRLPESAAGAGLAGRAVRVVGFGLPAYDNLDPFTRRSGTSRIEEVAETTLRLAPDPSQTCFGDSGGPAFLEATDLVVGITSTGDPWCEEFAIDTRVDVVAGDFIAPYIAVAAEGGNPAARGLDESCRSWVDCASGLCQDGACAQLCAPGDADRSCPSGYTCAAGGAEVGDFMCVADAQGAGGCAIAGRSTAPPVCWPLLILVAAAAFRRRARKESRCRER